MNAGEAAALVLKEPGSPLRIHEIPKRILARNFWKTAGKTPHQTVAGRLYMDIKQNGGRYPFVLSGPQTSAPRLASGIPQRQEDAKERERFVSTRVPKESYSFTDSAEKVLERFGNKHPMHYRAITAKVLEHGWLETEGRTPEASMYALILTEIRQYQKRGEQPRFVQHGKGYAGLSRWMGQGLAFEVEQHNKKARQALLKRLLEMKWEEFEELIARLLAEVGFEEIEMMGRSGDGGIDVRATLVVGEVIRTRMPVPVKKWKRNAPVVQQVRSILGTHEQGLIIATSDFSSGPQTEAAWPDAVAVALLIGEQPVVLLVENGIGVMRRSHNLIELDDAASGSWET